jgi:large subunit ribosomal protein L3
MVRGILGKKLGMTQTFMEDGRVVPVTILQAGPCIVVQRKTAAADGYEAAQLALMETRRVRGANKSMLGHFKKSEVAPARFLRELPVMKIGESETKTGDAVNVSMFQLREKVHVVGTSKGRGFAGVMKRHNFRGGKASHGSMFHRAPGSIGQSAYPSRVFKGMKSPGHMGTDRVTVRNLEIVKVNAEDNQLWVKGSIPGPNGGYLIIRKVQK